MQGLLRGQRLSEPDESAVRFQHFHVSVVPTSTAVLRAFHEKVQDSAVQNREFSEPGFLRHDDIRRCGGGLRRVLSQFRNYVTRMFAGEQKSERL